MNYTLCHKFELHVFMELTMFSVYRAEGHEHKQMLSINYGAKGGETAAM